MTPELKSENQPKKSDSNGEKTTKPQKEKKLKEIHFAKNFPRVAVNWIKDIIVAFVIVLLLYTYIFQFSQIKGNSMYPTLKDGERVIVEKITNWAGDFNRGDIITLKYPKDIGKNYVKRIIAFENETIAISNGAVYINGKRLDEPYVKNIEPYDNMAPVTVPEGYLFVMGDNRPASSDSRRWGFLPKGYAYGRVVMIIWPPGEIEIVD